ncbi:MAG TPA: hypothetical protein VK550_17390 [Polyangiaceae bacterium]|nr:hypothetical protein [Polyangiaceae bacterium]
MTRTVRAEEEPLIRYRASPACPDGAAFIARVRSRTLHAALAGEGAAARFVVTVSSYDRETVGRVEFAGSGEEGVVRHVAGKTCDEVVSAAALITALAIEATVEPEPVPVARLDDSDEAPQKEQTTPAPGAAPLRYPLGWGAGATVGIDGWSAPRGAYTFGAFGEMSGPTGLHLVRFGFRGATGSASIDERSAAFVMLGGRLSLCPVSLDLATHLEIAACAGIELGYLGGRGQPNAALPRAGSASIFWSAASTELLVRWRAGQIVVLEVGGELGFPLVRHNFIFEVPTQLIHEVPSVGAGVRVGAALHFR